MRTSMPERCNNVLCYPSRQVAVPRIVNTVLNLLVTKLLSRHKKFLIQKRFSSLLKERKMLVAQGTNLDKITALFYAKEGILN